MQKRHYYKYYIKDGVLYHTCGERAELGLYKTVYSNIDADGKFTFNEEVGDFIVSSMICKRCMDETPIPYIQVSRYYIWRDALKKIREWVDSK